MSFEFAKPAEQILYNSMSTFQLFLRGALCNWKDASTKKNKMRYITSFRDIKKDKQIYTNKQARTLILIHEFLWKGSSRGEVEHGIYFDPTILLHK